jgi:SH3 domain protein
MKWYVIIVVCLLFVSQTVQAETMYVNDVMKITMRTGPGIGHKIIAMVKSGQPVEVIDPGGEWAQVRIPSGKEGWVLRRFLTSDQPHRLLLTKLRQKHEALVRDHTPLVEENQTLKAENDRLSSELASSQKALSEVSSSYENLKSESAEFIKLKSDYEKTASDLAEKTKLSKMLEAELNKLQLHSYIWWFLAGAGVLLVGFILGFSTKRQRRRSSLL